MWVRVCACGRLDLRERWLTVEDAAASGVWDREWHCQECGGEAFELVEVDDG
jgi:hypothetical protein